jgi:CheY-like chemotaxis protein
MGGEICVSSRSEGGTTFWFELSMKPCTASEEARFLDEKRSDPAQEIQLAGRILLVDDNETNLLLGSMILESLGLEVTPVDGGAKAVAAATQSHFDLVLMDIAMPDIDGLEATRQIRTFVNSETLPVVALTAHIDDEEKRTCLEVGMNGYLTKPIVKERIKIELATWLDSNKSRQAEQPDEIIDEVSAASEHNIVDTSVLQDLIREIGRDNLRVVIDKVQTEVTKRWIELESTTAGGDITAMRRHVHSLASIFRSVGLIAIGNSLGSIESCLRSGNELAAGWLEDLAQLKVDSLRALDEQSDML